MLSGTAALRLARVCGLAWLACAMALAGEHPRLFLRKAQIETVRRAARTPEGRQVLERLDELLSRAEKGFDFRPDAAFAFGDGYWAAGHALKWLVSGGKEDLERAWKLSEGAMRLTARDWGGWANALKIAGVALAYDLCGEAWDPARRKATVEFLHGQRYYQRQQSADAYYQYGYKAACGLAGLAVLGDTPDEAEVARDVEKIKDELLAFQKTGLGDRGWRGGNWNGFADMMDLALPFLVAYRHSTGRDALKDSACEWVGPLAVMTDGRFHAELGRGAWATVLMGSSQEKYRPALKWFIEQYNADPDLKEGREPSRYRFHIRWPHQALFALLWTVDVRSRDPGEIMPKAFVDEAMQGYIFRSGWAGGRNCWVMLDGQARSVMPPVTAMNFHLSGLGARAYDPVTWIVGRRAFTIGKWYANSNRFDSGQHCAPGILRFVDGEWDIFPSGPPKRVHFASQPDGSGCVTLLADQFQRGKLMRNFFTLTTPHEIPAEQKPLGIRHLRALGVDYSGKSGAPCLVALVDKVSGAERFSKFQQMNVGTGKSFPELKLPEEGRPWPYPQRDAEKNLVNQPALIVEEGPELLALPGPALTVGLAADGKAEPPKATMRISYLTPQLLSLAPRGMYHRPEGGIIIATGGEEFFAVITIQEADAPSVRVQGQGLGAEAMVGQQTVRFDGQKVIFGK